MKQFADYGGNTPEVSGTAGSAKALGHFFDVHIGLEKLGVKALGFRGKNNVHPFSPRQSAVPFQVPGVFGEILLGTELEGIDKNADH